MCSTTWFTSRCGGGLHTHSRERENLDSLSHEKITSLSFAHLYNRRVFFLFLCLPSFIYDDIACLDHFGALLSPVPRSASRGCCRRCRRPSSSAANKGPAVVWEVNFAPLCNSQNGFTVLFSVRQKLASGNSVASIHFPSGFFALFLSVSVINVSPSDGAGCKKATHAKEPSFSCNQDMNVVGREW